MVGEAEVEQVVDVVVELEVADAVAHPLLHLGQAGERPGELGRRHRGGRPGDLPQPRRDRGGEDELIADDRVRAEPVDRPLHAGHHRVAERDEELVPEEAQGGDVAEPFPAFQHGFHPGTEVVGGAEDAGARTQQGLQGRPVSRPGDLVAPAGELGRDRADRGHVPGERRDGEQEAALRCARPPDAGVAEQGRDPDAAGAHRTAPAGAVARSSSAFMFGSPPCPGRRTPPSRPRRVRRLRVSPRW
ncbi:hypothetical protein [Actinomadura madurae]|uniref:hypothetical protein n=1 Tax=Actinomadura madurae TaxID=1993 RepID=UPI003D6B0871